MFWKMLKNDIKHKKGSSVVLFLFFTIASVLVFVGGVQIYEFFTGNDRNKTASNTSDVLIYNTDSGADKENIRNKINTVFQNNVHVIEHYRHDVIQLNWAYIDFEYFSEADSDDMVYANHYLTTIPKEGDLLFTMDDKPFAPENGTIWVSDKIRKLTGCIEGDVLNISNDMGDVYRFVIAGFYKQPYAGYNRWYVISQGDYDLLSQNIFSKYDLYGVKLDEMDIVTYIELGEQLKNQAVVEMEMIDPESSDEYVLSFILAVFIAIVSLFLILIAVMTIRFTMIAALKEEEREIGTLRAIGGMLGIIAGIPLSKTVMSMFMPDSISPSVGEILMIGICSVVFIIAVMIGFSLLAMRYINKISVVNAIRGENRAERIGKGNSLKLHKRKKMTPSFFLAFSDIIGRFKRYAFLFVAYTLGVLIILFVVNIKNSVIDPDFLKYSMFYKVDFFLDFTYEQLISYVERSANEGRSAWEIVNDDIKNAGIAAHIDDEHHNYGGVMIVNKNEVNTNVWFGSGDISQLSYHSGTIPVHEDEVALSWSASNKLGIRLGDEIILKLSVMPKGSYDYVTKEGKFKVTAFLNAMDGGIPIAVIGPEYKLEVQDKTNMAFIIDAEGEEKNRVFDQLEDYFGEDVVLTGEEYTKTTLAQYSELFDLLEYVVGGAVLLILALMTYLYTSIFIADETAEIALMKSIGFSLEAVKLSHIFRILILSVVSVLLGEILLRTAGQLIVGMCMDSLGISGFGFLPEFFKSFVAVPVLIMAVVLLTQVLNLCKIKNIDISNIKDE